MNSSPPAIESPPPAKRSFVERLIAWCALNRFLVLIGLFFAIAAGIYAIRNIPLDAIPDLSDVQVIVFTEWPGRAPTIVEDQVTYPIVSTLAAAPKVKYARGQTFFGLSFVSVIFEDGTDMYWARSRVLEYMNQVRNQLPENVNPVLGPDATGVGWVYEYALVDKTGKTVSPICARFRIGRFVITCKTRRASLKSLVRRLRQPIPGRYRSEQAARLPHPD